MAHERITQFQDLYKRLIHFSSIVGIFGDRQAGRTTFAASASPHYYTLDDRATCERVMGDPKKFLQTSGSAPVVIDECQVVPDLFPALKEHVRTHKKPGQFVLTGSVRFTSRKAIRESLAGRMTSIELYPLVLSELRRTPLPDTLPRLLELATFTDGNVSEILSSLREAKVVQGGLPGLCFIREERLRREGLLALHHLILDRDLRMILETRLSLESLERWISRIASIGWQPYNASEMKREFGFAHQTQKSLLFALEGIFMIRRIRLSGGRSGEIVLMEDQYEERALSEGGFCSDFFFQGANSLDKTLVIIWLNLHAN